MPEFSKRLAPRNLVRLGAGAGALGAAVEPVIATLASWRPSLATRAGLMGAAVLASSTLILTSFHGAPALEAGAEIEPAFVEVVVRPQQAPAVPVATPQPASAASPAAPPPAAPPAMTPRPAKAVPAWGADRFAVAQRRPSLASSEFAMRLPTFEDEAPKPAAAAAADEDDYTGIWAVNDKACIPQASREAFLPTVISAQGAWAGETTCSFKSGRREDRGWTFAALCSDATKSWKSNVHLQVDGRRLTWKSQSGTRTYVRCESSPPRRDWASLGQ